MSKKTAFFIVTAVETSNFKCFFFRRCQCVKMSALCNNELSTKTIISEIISGSKLISVTKFVLHVAFPISRNVARQYLELVVLELSNPQENSEARTFLKINKNSYP
jgi:hypothetical protein